MMKKTIFPMLSAATIGLLSSTVSSQASSILIDFGASAGTSTGNYNNIDGNGVTGNSSISNVEEPTLSSTPPARQPAKSSSQATPPQTGETQPAAQTTLARNQEPSVVSQQQLPMTDYI